MRTVMRRTGLTADTIRVWERRYGVVVPLRTGGNARRYSESDVQRLLSLREGVASGRSIGELARLSIDDLASLASVSPQAAHGESTSLVARYLDALRAFDVSTAEDLLSRCLLLAPSALVFEVAVPVLRALGNGWENGSVSIAEEHLATFQLRTLFAAALGGKRAARGAPAVVFAAPEGHAHELGVLMAATLALEHGLRPVCLGANTPTAELVLAARRTSASLIVLGIARTMEGAEQRALARSLARIPATLDLWLGVPEPGREGWPSRARVFITLESMDEALLARFPSRA
jgi:DNA-binding transcriptional MerR regulator